MYPLKIVDKQAVLEQHALEQLRRGDLRAAHQTLSTLLRYRPNDSQLRNRIQQVEHLVRQREEAQARIQAEPLRYAHAYIQAGRLVEGLKLLRAALAKDPGNQRLRDLALDVAARLRRQAEAPNGSRLPAAPSSDRPSNGPASSPAADGVVVSATSEPVSPPAPPGPAHRASSSVFDRMDPVRAGQEREEAIRRARREAEARARSGSQGANDPARQHAVARARAQAEARARSDANEEALAPWSEGPRSSSTVPSELPVVAVPMPEVSAVPPDEGEPPVEGEPTGPLAFTVDLTEESEDLEQTEVGPPPPPEPAPAGTVAPKTTANGTVPFDRASIPKSRPAMAATIVDEEDFGAEDEDETRTWSVDDETEEGTMGATTSNGVDPFQSEGLIEPPRDTSPADLPPVPVEAQPFVPSPMDLTLEPATTDPDPAGAWSARASRLKTLLDRIRTRARPSPSRRGERPYGVAVSE